ncbi:hypothetical protein [Kitasatospora sp. NPDC087315]|uniref:hypothetical protein n=1 Tax=Kitasatospora sp. NPDC087315 TaxID=3364069 RepID=UPI00380B3179
MTITAPARPGTDWVIRAIDVSRPRSPWENPIVPGTEFTADTQAELETHLPRIRAILADLSDGWNIPIELLRIIAVEYHGVAVAGTTIYPSTENHPDTNLALLSQLSYELTPGRAA